MFTPDGFAQLDKPTFLTDFAGGFPSARARALYVVQGRNLQSITRCVRAQQRTQGHAEPGTFHTMPLYYVDPNAERGPFYQSMVRFGRSKPGRFCARHISTHIDPWLYRATRGRFPAALGMLACAPLVTKGAKSGRYREVQLAYFHDGSDPILIASNYGEPKHPHWYYNLTANPDCQFGDQHFVATEVSAPDERTRLFTLAEQVYAGYEDYRLEAAAVGRQIPVFRLRPR